MGSKIAQSKSNTMFQQQLLLALQMPISPMLYRVGSQWPGLSLHVLDQTASGSAILIVCIRKSPAAYLLILAVLLLSFDKKNNHRNPESELKLPN